MISRRNRAGQPGTLPAPEPHARRQNRQLPFDLAQGKKAAGSHASLQTPALLVEPVRTTVRTASRAGYRLTPARRQLKHDASRGERAVHAGPRRITGMRMRAWGRRGSAPIGAGSHNQAGLCLPAVVPVRTRQTGRPDSYRADSDRALGSTAAPSPAVGVTSGGIVSIKSKLDTLGLAPSNPVYASPRPHGFVEAKLAAGVAC